MIEYIGLALLGGGFLLDALFILPYVVPGFPSFVARAVSFEVMILLSFAMGLVGLVMFRRRNAIQFRSSRFDLPGIVNGLTAHEQPPVQPAVPDAQALQTQPILQQPDFTGQKLTPVQAGLAAAIMRALSTVDVSGKCVLENIEVPLYGDIWKIEKLEILINNKQNVQPPVQRQEPSLVDLSELKP